MKSLQLINLAVALWLFARPATETSLAQSIDSFDPRPLGTSFANDLSTVWSLACQTDGKVLIGGEFHSIGGRPKSGFGRVLSDGKLDRDFPALDDTSWGGVCAVCIGPDGQMTTSAGGGLSRFRPDGSRVFGYDTYYVLGMASFPDGRIAFLESPGPGSTVLRRLNADGTVDQGFEVNFPTGSSYAMAADPGGAILVTASLDPAATQPPFAITRILADGTADPGFHADTDTGFAAIVLQPDGKILIGGPFATVNGVARSGVARLNSDGSLDPEFKPGQTVFGATSIGITSLALQADGKIVVGGDFTVLSGQPCRSIGRLHPDGSFDASFNPGTDNFLTSVAIESDGSVLAGGRFRMLGGLVRTNAGRILNTGPATQSLSTDGSSITWLRGGTSPEIWAATFEGSLDGTNWTRLGSGIHIDGGWKLSGLSLTSGARIRATGHVTGSAFNTSSWTVQSLGSFGTPGPHLSLSRGPAGTLTISWPSPSKGWNLQQNTSLSGGSWGMPPEAINDNGTTKSVTIDSTTGRRFFRLSQ